MSQSTQGLFASQVCPAYRRGREVVTEFDGFDSNSWQRGTASRGNDLLLGQWYDADGIDEEYDDYDDFDANMPDPWENMDPKYVNGRQVLINMQIT